MIKITTPLTQVDSYAAYTVGTRAAPGKNGNEYIYLPGVASLSARNWVVYQTANGTTFAYGSVTRLTNALCGPVAIAQATINSNSYGWFGIKGVFHGYVGAATSSGSMVWASGTAAAVDQTVTIGSAILGVVDCDTGISGGTATFILNYPFIPQHTL